MTRSKMTRSEIERSR